MHIEHGVHGGRTIVGTHNGTRVVNTGKHAGYVQHQYTTRGGHSYYSRTYSDNGKSRTGVYQGYNYGGQTYYGYTPTSYYQPAFYGWADSSWAEPVSFDASAWGWAGAPWYGYYGFTPYPYYAGPAFWLTDYLIAANLQAAYAVQAEVVVANAIPVQPLPMMIVENENSADSPTWSFNGTHGIGVFTTGNQSLTIQSFQNGTLVVRRQDASGFSALYVGQIIGNLISGQVTYYPGNGTAPVGTWRGTVQMWAPTPAVAVAVNLPPTLNECENGICGTWIWDGVQYNAQWVQGSVGILSVVKWDGSTLILNRVDMVGSTPGFTSTYTGAVVGPSTFSGTEVGVWPGHFNWNAIWNATSPTPILAPPSAAPPAPVMTSAPPSGSDPVTLTPEVKRAIAQEVKLQLEREQATAKGGQGAANEQADANGGVLPPALDPARRTFVVANDLSVTSNGQECGLTAGDVIARVTDTPDGDGMVNATVSASKKSDCAVGQTVGVRVDDLQEMQNHFAEQVDSGLGELAKKQGKGGIPKSPDTRTSASDVAPPPPDTAAVKTLDDQQHAADQAESQVNQEVAGSSGQPQ